MKLPRVWRRAGRRWAVGAGLVVLFAGALITVWYTQYAAEKPALEPGAGRDVPRQEKSGAAPKPSANVAERPSRERSPRP